MDDQPHKGQAPQPTPEPSPEPIPAPPEKSIDLNAVAGEDTGAVLTDILKSAAARAGGPLQGAVEEFLGGKGELLESTRSSLTRGKTAAKKEIAAFLVERFKLAPAVAKVVANLLIRLVPALGELVGGEETQQTKPRRKKKSASKTAKKTATKKKKKPKKKTAARKTTSKTAAKKKPKPTTAKKKPRSASKTKKRKKTT